jgi:hypothetical protein
MAATTRLLEEHQKLAQVWLEAERERVNILQKVLQEYGDKCITDYPENLFRSYEEALAMAAQPIMNMSNGLPPTASS